MAYRRRKPFFKPYQRFGKRVSATSNRSAIRKLQKTLKQVELKFVDSAIDATTILQSGVVFNQVFIIPEGDGQSDRHGRKIQLKSVAWRGTVTMPAKTDITKASDTLRLLIVKDKSANGALPLVTDVLQSGVYESFLNLENKSRFVILSDRYFPINSQGGVGDGVTNITIPTEKFFNTFKKFDVPIEYNDTATSGVVSTINTNNIVIIAISRLANAGLESCIRFRYTDM